MLVREHRILTTGYNGAPRGVAHCTEVGCTIVSEHCLRATHAEANAVVQGALHGVSLQGATAYCTHQPCVNCSKLLISAGVTKIVYDEAYPDTLASQLLAEAGVALVALRDARGCARMSPHQVSPGIIYAAAFIIAAVVSGLATPLIVRLALHLAIVDDDGHDRRMHDLPKPRVGGIAVFFGFAFALFTVLGVTFASPLGLFRRRISSMRSTGW